MAAAPVPQVSVPRRDTRDVRLAWACFVASPVFIVLAFAVGEAMSALLGYDGIGPPPVGVGVLSVVAALVVFSIPAAPAVWFARRALAQGDDRAKVPAVVLVVMSAGFLALNLFSWIIGLVFG
jgi:hypothetical protein